MANLFQSRDILEFTKSLTRYQPGGKLFRAKNKTDKILHKFFNGLSVEAQRANELLRAYNEQYYPDTTVSFLVEWEQALGIPDDCLSGEGTNDERRRDILVKLVGMAVQTAADFEALALDFGIIAVVLGGKDASVSPPITPDSAARNTIVVQFTPATVFPYTFPIMFGGGEIVILTCLFENIKPANNAVRFDSI